ncbi:AMP-binding protein [Tistrella mobilis]|uniref:AMP-binding protein n=1 Tax=Tistrella mobilis TaxID=171437 RepID=UPI003557B0E1
MMPETDRRGAALLARLDATPTPLALLDQVAAARPAHPALEYLPDAAGTPAVAVPYDRLLADVHRAAAALRRLGVGPDNGVAILLPFVPQVVTAVLAAATAGIAFPVNLLLSAEAIAAQLRLARVRVVVTMGPHPALDVRARVAAAVADAPGVATVVEVPVGPETAEALGWAAFLALGEGAGKVAPGDADRVAAFIHTGGTTGAPKLAQLSSRNLVAATLMVAAGNGMQPDDRVLTGLPLFHVGGLVDVLLAALSEGATVIFPTATALRNPAVVGRFWEIVDETRTSLIGSVPTILAAIVDAPRGSSTLATLRGLLTGGSPLAPELAKRVEAVSGRPVSQLYGMTETGGIVAVQPVDGRFHDHAVGPPVPLMQVEMGAGGEIRVAGPNVFQGYLTEAGVEGAPADGWFASGDLGDVLPSGELRITGRAKDVIIRSGHNIDPVLIEEVAHRHPAVAQAAAVAMPDDYAGELPVLYVMPRAGAECRAEDVAAFVAAAIAEPPARPRHVFVVPDLPLTPLGKIARFRLRQDATLHRVRVALADIAPGAEVYCTDPAAREVVVEVPGGLDEARRATVITVLARLGLILAEE